MITKGDCGEGVETCVNGKCGFGSGEEHQRRRQRRESSLRFISGVSSVLGQWCWRGLRGEREEKEWERNRGQRFNLSPPCRSSHSGVHFGTVVSVSPTGTWRWHNPQSLCPSR